MSTDLMAIENEAWNLSWYWEAYHRWNRRAPRRARSRARELLVYLGQHREELSGTGEWAVERLERRFKADNARCAKYYRYSSCLSDFIDVLRRCRYLGPELKGISWSPAPAGDVIPRRFRPREPRPNKRQTRELRPRPRHWRNRLAYHRGHEKATMAEILWEDL
jgi:hypothetical protein